MNKTLNFLNELKNREMYYQNSNFDEKTFEINKIYAGFDATAKSLQIGNLVTLAGLRLAEKNGISTIAILGGATTQVGDPTGKNEARKQQKLEVINENMTKIEEQITKLIPQSKLLNNANWLSSLTFMDFLNNTANYISTGSLLKLKMFANRLENNDPLSIKELLYPLMQAYDFLWLYEKENCNAQCGGADQWCNILTGSELIAKKHKNTALSITFPLITTKDGVKMGKSLKGAIYIDKEMCSIYDFWQYWRNIDDSITKSCLKKLTLLEVEEIDKINDINQAKIALANEMTSWVHGKDAAKEAEKNASAIFINKNLDYATEINVFSKKLSEIIKATKHVETNTSAKTLIEQGAIKINNEVIKDKNHETELTKFTLTISKKHHFKIDIK